MSILVTGHTGFVGSALVHSLATETIHLVGRRTLPDLPGVFYKKDLTANENFSDCLSDVSVVIHLAARVHVMVDAAEDPLVAYRQVNLDATMNLAHQAATAGVKRFIFISTIKVNGEETKPGQVFAATDTPSATDPYGISKAEAEEALKQFCYSTGMEFVIIRPPLVYGPGVKANFAAMLRLAKKNLPLPLGSFHNSRSMVALGNLVDLIKTCIDHPKAANQTFLVSDGRDLSTTELLKLMTASFGKRSRLFPVPIGLFKLLGKLTGKQAIFSRLCGNLQVDISQTKQLLGWSPPVTVEDGIKACIRNEDVC